jgi:hypothetical protein
LRREEDYCDHLIGANGEFDFGFESGEYYFDCLLECLSERVEGELMIFNIEIKVHGMCAAIKSSGRMKAGVSVVTAICPRRR